MSGVHNNSVETVNAAATAIITAESRVQPSNIQKRRWRSFWSRYSCFGSNKNGKRIGHAVLVPESTIPRLSASIADMSSQTTAIVIPFIAPPSSPASFLQSDPPSATLSPARVRPVDSSSISETASGYAIGPYAHETQLVSPPVFSAFTTEPSTASFTPPPEQIQSTTPSSPEVPFAELLSTSLARSRKKYEANLRFPLSQYDYQPYGVCPGSPGSRVLSTGSTKPNSGTSSPFTSKPPKSLSYDHFARKWGSSKIGSGSLTPNGGVVGGGWGSRLGSGTITPSGDRYIPETEISEVASLANSGHESENEEETIVDHRLSFELTGVPHPDENEPNETIVKPSSPSIDAEIEAGSKKDSVITTNTLKDTDSFEGGDEIVCVEKRQSSSLGSSKDFNFDNTKQESLDRSMIEDCEWWKKDSNNRAVAATEMSSSTSATTTENNWTFFPVLQHGVSL